MRFTGDQAWHIQATLLPQLTCIHPTSPHLTSCSPQFPPRHPPLLHEPHACPAVSHRDKPTVELPKSSVALDTSTPIVDMDASSYLPSASRTNKHVLPVPESPTMMILNGSPLEAIELMGGAGGSGEGDLTLTVDPARLGSLT